MVQAYNYMIENYHGNREVKYQANKRSELKKIYSNIVNLSKHSPFYKINLSGENQDYTIGIKERALNLKAKITDMIGSDNESFQSKVVTVSNNRILDAKLIAEDNETLPQHITFLVHSLATPQVNLGRELFHPSKGLKWGTYEFEAKIKDQVYPLTFFQEEGTDNQKTLHRMAEFINQSLPFLVATVETGERRDYSRLVLQSEITGQFGERTFSFSEDEIYGEGIVDFFGLDRMNKAPTNASFELNGISKQTTTNTFTLENTLQISLKQAGETPVSLRIVPDQVRILDKVDEILQVYNNLIQIAEKRREESREHYGATKLISELMNLSMLYSNELEACGIRTSDNGKLKLEDSLAILAAEDGGMEDLFKKENGFIAKVLEKAGTITINPMEYLDKTIVTYPNNKKTAYANPYVTSMYSGLFFNSYC